MILLLTRGQRRNFHILGNSHHKAPDISLINSLTQKLTSDSESAVSVYSLLILLKAHCYHVTVDQVLDLCLPHLVMLTLNPHISVKSQVISIIRSAISSL